MLRPVTTLLVVLATALVVTACVTRRPVDSSGPSASDGTASADTTQQAAPSGRTGFDRQPSGNASDESSGRAQNGGQGAVSTPFQDPAAASAQEQPGEYERPYSRHELKQSRPLEIDNRTEAPYEDPGVEPITGQVQLSDDKSMVRLPDGTFIMGLTDEDPFDIQNAGRKRITVSAFSIDRYEVTNREYRRFLNSLGPQARAQHRPDSTVFDEVASRANWETYFRSSTYATYPVVGVTWQDAKAYCEWAGMRLPTEAEWEYAARAGRLGGIYPWAGFSPQDARGQFLANYNPGRMGQAADGYAFTAPVGSFPPSRWGLHDMSGNVAEWVADSYAPTYRNLEDLDPVYVDPDEPRRVVRGGSWSANAFRIGVGYRDFQRAGEASSRIGFRCAAGQGQVNSSGGRGRR